MKGNPLSSAATPRLKTLFLLTVLTATPGLAAAQFKCVDKAGNITLTDLACPGRNTRGQRAERPASVGAAESAQSATRNNSATAPAKPQPLDAANERPPARKPASAA
jgi:hypothetical protein